MPPMHASSLLFSSMYTELRHHQSFWLPITISNTAISTQDSNAFKNTQMLWLLLFLCLIVPYYIIYIFIFININDDCSIHFSLAFDKDPLIPGYHYTLFVQCHSYHLVTICNNTKYHPRRMIYIDSLSQYFLLYETGRPKTCRGVLQTILSY